MLTHTRTEQEVSLAIKKTTKMLMIARNKWQGIAFVPPSGYRTGRLIPLPHGTIVLFRYLAWL
jgi:hypothetical protein